MNFSQFCMPFYSKDPELCGLNGLSAQYAIANFIIETALGPHADEYQLSDDLSRKWLTGKRNISPKLWTLISKYFDQNTFSQAVAAKINDKMLPQLADSFGISNSEDNPCDKYVFSTALAEQFKEIADKNGDGNPVIVRAYQKAIKPIDFPVYCQNAYRKYSKLKTLLYSSEERPFDEFFVCNTIRMDEMRTTKGIKAPDEIIEDVTLEKLSDKSKDTILVGMGGIGKSMMMRHLFLDALQEYKKSGTLPIMVILREYGSDSKGLMELIIQSVQRFDPAITKDQIIDFIIRGKCRLLLDGLDEIKAKDMVSFLKELDLFMDQYPNNQTVMSSRRISSFVALTRFTVLWMEPFSHEQSLQLIDKLKYCEEEPKIKENFKKRLREDLFNSHKEFASNPLLLTLMLMNYRRFSDVPEKKHFFYQQAYDTLLHRQDAAKLAFKREFRCVSDPSDFTAVFREFCAKSYRRGDYEFNHARCEYYFDKLHSKEKLDQNLMKPDYFIYDACNSVCLMFEEAETYYFLHRSFQEYFFADYYSRQSDKTLKKLGRLLQSTNRFIYDDTNAFRMLYEFAPDRVQECIFLPFLSNFFDGKDKRTNYYNFLRDGYKSLGYTILFDDLIRDYCTDDDIQSYRFHLYNEPSSIILAQICKESDIDAVFTINFNTIKIRQPENAYSVLVGEMVAEEGTDQFEFQMASLPLYYIENPESCGEPFSTNNLIKDQDGAPLVFGYDHSVELQKVLDNPEKYSTILTLLDSEDFPAKKVYKELEKYYDKLADKVKKAAEAEDDF